MLLKTVGLIIGEYNEEGNAARAIEHIKSLGLNCVTDLEAIIGTSEGFPDTISEPSLSCFVFTDSREAADRLKERGIGFAVYRNSRIYMRRTRRETRSGGVGGMANRRRTMRRVC